MKENKRKSAAYKNAMTKKPDNRVHVSDKKERAVHEHLQTGKRTDSRVTDGRRTSGRQLEGRKADGRRGGNRGNVHSPGSQSKGNRGLLEETSAITIKTVPTGDKVKAPCPHFSTCGGCQLQDISYADTLSYKQRLSEELLGKFGEVSPIMGMQDPFHYRNKSHTTYTMDRSGLVKSGMFEEFSHKVVPIDRCLLHTAEADAIAVTIRNLMKSFKMMPFDEDTEQGFLRHVLIKVGMKTGQIMVVLVVSSHMFPSKNNFVKALRDKHPGITTILANVNPYKTSMVLSKREIILFGKGYIEDELCGTKFRISAKSFFQINPVQTEKLYGAAIGMAGLTGKETVLDAYSGIGTIGLIAAPKAKRVIGVELNPDAVADAIENAKGNKITNAMFKAGDAGEFMVGMAKEGIKLDVVFMDPPRSGSDDKFIASIIKAGPKRVVYVSCNPMTLARDLEKLVAGGYAVKGIQPVDMFPWTGHVEAVVKLEKL